MEVDEPDATIPAGESVMIAAFEGWNDAGAAASSALTHLAKTWAATEHTTVDPEEYHDFQVSRPSQITLPSGDRVLEWPGTVVSTATGPWPANGRRSLVQGIEPSMRWRTFVGEVLNAAAELEVTTLMTCGALLLDVPHTRPLPSFISSEDKAVRERFGLEASQYEGPTGILGVLGHEAQLRGISVLTLWVGVPHYIAHPPNPKATITMLTQIERLLGEPIDLGDLPDEADAWQRGADELVDEDDEIAEHVSQLESLMDETSLPEASGDAIAAEFEKFLRRRDDGGHKRSE